MRLHAQHIGVAPAGQAFQLRKLALPTTVLQRVDGLQHVLIGLGCHRLQLDVSGADILHPVHLVLNAITDHHRLGPTVAGLQRLNRVHAGAVKLQQGRVRPGGKRLAIVLRILDARLAGVSYRAIATVLFGRARVQADWSDPRAHLRDHLRRAARRGHDLVGGGYRRLLC